MSDLVLVIDDDATLLGLLAQHLSRAAYHVITAMSGSAGLQMFYDHHPDLVILDIMMPKMNGWAVCERIREASDVPIIMLTAKGEEQDRLRGFRLGLAFRPRPFSHLFSTSFEPETCYTEFGGLEISLKWPILLDRERA